LAEATAAYTEPRAHALRERYRALFGGDEIPVPIESLAEDLLGLHVTETELDGVSGLLIPAERQIYINASDTPARRRFTLAHELGHWVCQCLEGTMKPVYCRAEEVGADLAGRALEREANIFAAELLMPEPELRRRFLGSSSEAAAEFAVSSEAMSWRLYNLGFVDERPA
jgi:Zn-dependent peptidase ImmA (M78 family)